MSDPPPSRRELSAPAGRAGRRAGSGRDAPTLQPARRAPAARLRGGLAHRRCCALVPSPVRSIAVETARRLCGSASDARCHQASRLTDGRSKSRLAEIILYMFFWFRGG